MAAILAGVALWEDFPNGGDWASARSASVKINRGSFGARGRGALVGPVSHVRDGDTFEIGGVAVRFSDFDCAELGTERGAAAKRALRDVVRGREMSCTLNGETSYDRVIGICRLDDGTRLRDAMRARGVCRD
ncbi:thermonuclease family protein [Roseivivax sp. CAU 1753]